MTNFLSFFSSKTAIGIEVRFLHRQQTTAVLAFASDSSNPASVDERDWFWVLCHSFGQRQYAHVTWSRPQLCHRIQWRSPIQSFILSKRFQTRYVLPIIRTVFYGLNNIYIFEASALVHQATGPFFLITKLWQRYFDGSNFGYFLHNN